MENDLQKIKTTAKNEIATANSLDAIESVRLEYLGRKGAVNLILKSLKDLPANMRKKIGLEANALKNEIEKLIADKKAELEKTGKKAIMSKGWLDVTRPGKKPEKGHFHPLTLMLREITEIFSSMGFETITGPEVESEYNNFDALNIPQNHPAREMHDTFWVKQEKNPDTRKNFLLRTHISSLQVPFMKKNNPPYRFIAPGRVYRYEASDASHDIQFDYVEGMMANKNISIANFKAIMREFFSRLFAQKTKIRLRPSFFPFTEPSFEVDITCAACDRGHSRKKTQKNAERTKCSVCKGAGWLEIMGAGMTHPNVFKNAGLNPKNIQGFAFGIGLDRLTMMKYKIPDVRLFRSGDLRFLKQF